MDFGYEEGKFAFLFQGTKGNTSYLENLRNNVDLHFAMTSWQFDSKLSLITRYDYWSKKNQQKIEIDRGDGYTGAINYKKSSKELIQLECLLARPTHGSTTDTSPLWQIRYVVSF